MFVCATIPSSLLLLRRPPTASSFVRNFTPISSLQTPKIRNREKIYHKSFNSKSLPKLYLPLVFTSSPTTRAMLYPWPDHWYFDQDYIRCIVPQCEFVTPSHMVGPQWDQLHEHCEDTSGAEHAILLKMLSLRLCAIGDCSQTFTGVESTRVTRYLFAHEKTAHGSVEMFNICSFVRLAREGRIRGALLGEACEKLAFHRMLGKAEALPDGTKKALFQRSGFYYPEQHTPQNMGKILTADPLAQQGESPPYWWPIRADHFLWLIRPNTNDPADHQWSMVWTGLREEYANGRF